MSTAPGAWWDMPTIVVVVAMLAVISTARVSLRWFVRRQQQRRPDPEQPWLPDEFRVRRWLMRGSSEILPPAALLIWVHGLSTAAALLFSQMIPSRAEPALLGLRWIYGASVVAGIFWLLSRVEAFLTASLPRLRASFAGGSTPRTAMPQADEVFT